MKPHFDLRLVSLFLIFVAGILSGCGGDDPEPVQAEVKAKLLAGEPGSSKSWKLLSVMEKEGTSAEHPVTFYACWIDNIYTFSNNPAQDYELGEGALKCSTSDPATIEKGTWSFTLDGTKLTIQGTTQYTGALTSLPFAAYFPYPAEVLELSESILKTKMTYTSGGVTIVDTFTFNKN